MGSCFPLFWCNVTPGDHPSHSMNSHFLLVQLFYSCVRASLVDPDLDFQNGTLKLTIKHKQESYHPLLLKNIKTCFRAHSSAIQHTPPSLFHSPLQFLLLLSSTFLLPPSLLPCLAREEKEFSVIQELH